VPFSSCPWCFFIQDEGLNTKRFIGEVEEIQVTGGDGLSTNALSAAVDSSTSFAA
jgi:hypothetical protein